MDHVVGALKPGLELIPVMRAAWHAGIADILHRQERAWLGEVHDDAVLGAGGRSVRRQLTARVAYRVGAAIDRRGTDIERSTQGRRRKRMTPVRDVHSLPSPVFAQTFAQQGNRTF